MLNTSVSFAQFFYRVNPDKTIDSICGYCFVASDPVADQTELRVWETAHRCANWMKESA